MSKRKRFMDTPSGWVLRATFNVVSPGSLLFSLAVGILGLIAGWPDRVSGHPHHLMDDIHGSYLGWATVLVLSSVIGLYGEFIKSPVVSGFGLGAVSVCYFGIGFSLFFDSLDAGFREYNTTDLTAMVFTLACLYLFMSALRVYSIKLGPSPGGPDVR